MRKLHEVRPSLRMFPILIGYDRKEVIEAMQKAGSPYLPVCVPWDMLASHEKQAQHNHGGQTLERLAQRGGLAASEAVAILEDREFQRMALVEANETLCRLTAQWVDQEIARLTIDEPSP